MAIEYGGLDITLPSVANTAIVQYAGQILAATGISATTGNNVVTCGFAQEAKAAGGANVQTQVSVRVNGVTKAIAAATAPAPGVHTSPAAAGAVVTAAADGNAINGICLAQANTVAADIFPLLIFQSRRS